MDNADRTNRSASGNGLHASKQLFLKAILLCAGRGLRMMPRTIDRPKCLLEVDGAALIEHQLAALEENGVSEIVIVAGYRASAVRRHILARESASRIAVVENSGWADTGSAASLACARDGMTGSFCVIIGDVLFSSTLLQRALNEARAGLTLLVERSPPLPDDMRVVVRGDRVRAVGKQLGPAADHRSVGIVICHDAGETYRSALDRVLTAPQGANAYHHAVIDALARSTLVRSHAVTGSWMEFDSEADLAMWAAAAAPHRAPALLG